jgi:hypothetical protein
MSADASNGSGMNGSAANGSAVNGSAASGVTVKHQPAVRDAPAARDEPIGHERAFELLPWLANGSLAADERRRVERHVRDCLPCRAELKEQQTLAALVRSHPAVHVSAEEGFARLRHAIDGQPRAPSGRSAVAAFDRLRAAGRRSGARWLAVAASVAVAAGGASWLAWSVSREAADERYAPRYATAADPVGGERARIDVIFADGATEEQMRALLEELDATIVGGPTALGRYTLQLRPRPDAAPAAPSDAELDALIRRLLADGRVRFAGRTFTPAAVNGSAP